jgi:MFS family permease
VKEPLAATVKKRDMRISTAAACTASAGLALMALEICAPRLLAPAFGSGTIVWASLIAAIMLALSAGGLLGGRLADRGAARAAPLVLTGGALAVGVAAVASPSVALALSSRASATPTAQLAALGATSVALFVLPATLLAAVFPICLRAVLADVAAAGRAYGVLYLASTLGGLIGVLLPPLLLVNSVGTRASVLILSLAPLGCGLWLWVGPGAALVLMAAMLVPGSRGPRAWESAYAAYRLETVKGETCLRVDDEVIYSIYDPGLRVTGHYYDAFVAAPLLLGLSPRRIAVLGLGGGTLVHLFRAEFPQARLEAVEIDPTLIDAAGRFFNLDPSRVACADGRCWLRKVDGAFDLVAVDAMCGATPPVHMMTIEFMREAASRLTERGALVINVLPPLDGRVAAAAARALPHVMLIGNVVVASRHPIEASDISRALDWSGWKVRARELLASLRSPPDVAPLDDDRGGLPWWWGLHVDPAEARL